MTPRQAQLLSFIESYETEHGYAPTFGEMRTALGFRSKSSAHRLLKLMVREGSVVKAPNETHRAYHSARDKQGPPWRGIASAPKDGTWVILGHREWLSAAEGRFDVFDGSEDDGLIPCWYGGDGDNFDPQPTHWMPLPAPPK